MKKARRTLTVLALVLASVASPAPSVVAAENGRIYFHSYREGKTSIFSVRADGTDLRRLTTSPTSDFDPAVSQDGSKIAFIRHNTSDPAAGSSVWLINSDGTNLREIYHGPGGTELSSPDWGGGRIALTYKFSTEDPEIIELCCDGRSDGWGLEFLREEALRPQYSPDGLRLAFVLLNQNGTQDIATMRFDGTDLFRVTNDDAFDDYPAYSPDGSGIIFTSYREGGPDIFRAYGTEITRVFSGEGAELAPTYSPDGTKIAFSWTEAIWTINPDGTGATPLLCCDSITESEPDWGVAFGDEVACTITGHKGDELLVGTDGDDVICGMGGSDVIRGGLGDDQLRGGAGADIFDEGSSINGSDVIQGGRGIDIVSYAGRTNEITVTVDGSYGDGEVTEGDYVVTDVEGVTGGSADDTLTMTVGRVEISGGAGNDNITGGNGIDRLNGGEGDDNITGRGGDDWISGNDGRDTLIGSAGNDRITGHAGNDLLSGDDGADRLFGSAGEDQLSGDSGDDVLNGDSGDDSFFGGTDDDTMRGGDDNDSFLGEDGNDSIDGEAGDDRAEGRAGNDEIIGGLGNDILYGDPGNDRIYGQGGNDYASGDRGRDVLSCGPGTDRWHDIEANAETIGCERYYDGPAL